MGKMEQSWDMSSAFSYTFVVANEKGTMGLLSTTNANFYLLYVDIDIYPTPPLGQDMTQGQLLSGL